MYYEQSQDGYIVLFGVGSYGQSISEERYNDLLEAVKNKPLSPEGYEYRLNTDLNWELCEFCIEDTDDEAAEATAADYQAALSEFGVKV